MHLGSGREQLRVSNIALLPGTVTGHAPGMQIVDQIDCGSPSQVAFQFVDLLITEFMCGIRPILRCTPAFFGSPSVQVTATKLGWTRSRTPINFLLFSGEICSALVTES